MPTGFVRWFNGISSGDIELVGGKGLNLGIMYSASLPVPNGFVITTEAYDSCVRHNGIQSHIDRLLACLHAGPGAQAEARAAELEQVFSASEMPAALASAVGSAYTDLAGTTEAAVAVRSSAVAEDLAGASFAGQHESFLNVQGVESLLAAVRRCWASLWSTRAILYREKQGVPQDAQRMAVVVQRMVASQLSGVAFTANPLTGARHEMVLNTSQGLGDSLVEGEVIPDVCVVDRSSGKITDFAAGSESGDSSDALPGRTERPADRREPSSQWLSKPLLQNLLETAARIESLFGTPMDVEWALSDGTLAIVQARPITALPPEPVRWVVPGPGVWVHGGGIMEFQVEPISPLTASLIEGFFSTVYGQMAPFIRTSASWPPVRVVNGCLYSCLTYRVRPWHLPAVAQLVKQHLTSPSRWRAELERYQAVLELLSATELDTLPACALVTRLEDILRAFFRYYFHYASMVQVLTNAEGKFTRFYERQVKSTDDPEPALFLQGLNSKVTESQESLAALSRQVSADPALVAHIATGGTDWLEDTSENESVDVFRRRVRNHVARFGYQMYALDFIVPTLGEQSDLVRSAIKAAAAQQAGANAQGMSDRRRKVLKRLRERLTAQKWRQFRRLMDKARSDLEMKENAVFEIGRAIPLARAHFLELGRRLADVGALQSHEEVFFLTSDELSHLAAQLDEHTGIGSVGNLVAQRQREHRQEKNIEAPPFLPVGSKPAWWLSHVMPLPETGGTVGDSAIKGVAVSPGVITGTARVIPNIGEIHRLRPGDILVTEATPPAWTPFFAQIAGLVTNRGGKLTHSSIVAREFGIPVVMGTVNATRLIADGQRITVDGGRGTVSIAEH